MTIVSNFRHYVECKLSSARPEFSKACNIMLVSDSILTIQLYSDNNVGYQTTMLVTAGVR
jgi:hypothetical protein